MATKWCEKLEVASKRCPIVFRGHPSYFKVTRADKSTIWIQNWVRWLDRSLLSNPSNLPCSVLVKYSWQIWVLKIKKHGSVWMKLAMLRNYRIVKHSFFNKAGDLQCPIFYGSNVYACNFPETRYVLWSGTKWLVCLVCVMALPIYYHHLFQHDVFTIATGLVASCFAKTCYIMPYCKLLRQTRLSQGSPDLIRFWTGWALWWFYLCGLV